MRESDLQERVTDAILEREDDNLILGITDNGRCVVADLGDMEALYTAEEARELAGSIWQYGMGHGEWDNDEPYGLIVYLHELADVVNGNKTAEELSEQWDGQSEVTKEEMDQKLKEVAERPHPR